jgi:TolB protein
MSVHPAFATPYSLALRWPCRPAAGCRRLTAGGRAQLVIEITQGVDDPTPIAVVPFAWEGAGAAPEDLALVVQEDLERSGQFEPCRGRTCSASEPRRGAVLPGLAGAASEYVLIGARRRATVRRILPLSTGRCEALRRAAPGADRRGRPRHARRRGAHAGAPRLRRRLRKAHGIPGAFATRLIYVSVTRNPTGKDYYRLTLADSDGARPIVLLESREPIMSPSWSPDGKQVAYVSFETDRPAIFRQVLATGEREQLTNFRGLNSSPAWSPDGNTWPWCSPRTAAGYLPDGPGQPQADPGHASLRHRYGAELDARRRSFLFTSDRGGRPQIYRYDLQSGLTERVTFEGNYNARARVAQDGRNVVLVHQRDGEFQIAIHDLVTSRLQVLTNTQLDESPSIAPNGSMVLYATKYGDRGILSAVSVDGGIKFRLPARSGDVREPAWSPYMSP